MITFNSKSHLKNNEIFFFFYEIVRCIIDLIYSFQSECFFLFYFSLLSICEYKIKCRRKTLGWLSSISP